MDLFSQPELLERYLEQNSSPEDPVLTALARHTWLNEVHPRMLSGKVMGQFLSLFSALVQPESILEIGTYTGYSAICLAQGLRTGGKLITLEANDELREISLDFFRQAGLDSRIELLNGDALDIIPSLEPEFDLVFIDANKEDYLAYYELIIDKVSPGGYILADNVLWGGKVLENDEQDQSTRAIREFNIRISEDQRVTNVLLPIRDGVMVIRKT